MADNKPSRTASSTPGVADTWDAPSWREAAVDYHKQRAGRVLVVESAPERLKKLRALLNNNVSLETACAEMHQHHFAGRAAASTVEALMYSLREHGTAALDEPPTKRRIRQLSEQQLHEVAQRLERLKPKIAKPWTADEVVRLVEAWTACHGR